MLFDYRSFDKICDKIKYLISAKSGIADSILFYILIKSIVNENKNNYYYNIFLEKGTCKDKSNTRYF